MSSHVLEMISEFPNSISFGPDVPGKTFVTTINRRAVELVMPGVEPNGDDWKIIAPTVQAVRPDVDWNEYLHDYWAWASVNTWQQGPEPAVLEVGIKHVLLRVPLEDGEFAVDKGKQIANDFAESTKSWWYSVKDWAEVISGRILYRGELPENTTLIQNTQAWSFDGEHGHNVPITTTLTIVQDSGVPLEAHAWEKILQLAAVAQAPPTPHLFLRSTRQAMRERRPRTAVLDAATAAELALNMLLDKEMQAAPEGLAQVVRKQNRELGRMIDLLRSLGVDLPQNLKPDLAYVRNEAIHGAVEPTLQQATMAAGLAHGLVERVYPTDDLLS